MSLVPQQAMSVVAMRRDFFEKNKLRLADALPEIMKHLASRFIAVALVYISKHPHLQEIDSASLFAAVVDGARLGLMADGRLGYLVVYNTKKKLPNGSFEWVKEVNFQSDYKGLLAIARRNKVISDATTNVICQHDVFNHGLRDGGQYLEHTWDAIAPRGDIRGAYCRLLFPSGNWAYRLISRADIERARAASKSPDAGAWQNWYESMAMKVVVRSMLKMYADDPDLAHAMELDEREYAVAPAVSDTARIKTLADLTQSLGASEAVSTQPLQITEQVNEPFIDAAEMRQPEAIDATESVNKGKKKPAREELFEQERDPFSGIGQ